MFGIGPETIVMYGFVLFTLAFSVAILLIPLLILKILQELRRIRERLEEILHTPGAGDGRIHKSPGRILPFDGEKNQRKREG